VVVLVRFLCVRGGDDGVRSVARPLEPAPAPLVPEVAERRLRLPRERQ